MRRQRAVLMTGGLPGGSFAGPRGIDFVSREGARVMFFMYQCWQKRSDGGQFLILMIVMVF